METIADCNNNQGLFYSLERQERGKPMNDRGIRRLENHRADHARVAGEPFQHFFCPILFADEDVELMRGHVINEGFKGAPGTWAVQRKDVDNFFGAAFESDYLLSQRMAGKSVLDFFFDKVLFTLARPEIYFKGRKLHYFLRPRFHRCRRSHCT